MSIAEMHDGAIVVSAVCGTPAGGEQFASSIPDTARRHTGMHVLLKEIDIPQYTGDRPTSPNACGVWPTDKNGVVQAEPYPEPPIQKQPGNANPSLIDSVKAGGIGRLTNGFFHTTCLFIEVHESQFAHFSNDIILAVWTQENRHNGLKSATGGDTCHDNDQTGIDYLRIPKQFPQYLRIAPSEGQDNRPRLYFPRGICKSTRPRVFWAPILPGALELHVEFVSGGTGHVYFFCDDQKCVPPERPTGNRAYTWLRFFRDHKK